MEEREREAQEQRRKLEAEKRQGSFDQLMCSYVSAMEADGKRSYQSVARSLETYVKKPFPEMITRPANTIEADDIRLILARMIDRGVTTHTNRVRSYLHAAFQHGLNQDNNPRRYTSEGVKFNLKYNPVSFVPKQSDFERVGEHVITEKEVREIWKMLPKESQVISLAVKLAFTTGQRLGELLRIRWEHIDLKERVMLIPASISKNETDHLVPLNDLSMDVFREIKPISEKCEHVFPGSRKGEVLKDKRIHSTTVAKIVREFCGSGDKVRKFIGRDIRRTVKTLMGKAGIDKAIRDRVQNHAQQDISSKHYDRYDYLPEKRRALKVWNDYLDLVIHPRKKVTHISRKRA